MGFYAILREGQHQIARSSGHLTSKQIMSFVDDFLSNAYKIMPSDIRYIDPSSLVFPLVPYPSKFTINVYLKDKETPDIEVSITICRRTVLFDDWTIELFAKQKSARVNCGSCGKSLQVNAKTKDDGVHFCDDKCEKESTLSDAQCDWCKGDFRIETETLIESRHQKYRIFCGSKCEKEYQDDAKRSNTKCGWCDRTIRREVEEGYIYFCDSECREKQEEEERLIRQIPLKLERVRALATNLSMFSPDVAAYYMKRADDLERSQANGRTLMRIDELLEAAKEAHRITMSKTISIKDSVLSRTQLEG